MKFNNFGYEKGFILYDALLSLLVLSGFILFFVQVVQVVQKQEISVDSHVEAINDVRRKYYSNKNISRVCSQYLKINGQKQEVCFE